MTPSARQPGQACRETEGDRLHYAVVGSGRPVLLLHGAFGSVTNFLTTDFAAGLSEDSRLIAPDALGHGQSDGPSEPSRYSARRQAARLSALLDALELERAHVVGYSMGGWMASALAAFHPDRVATVAIGGWDVSNGMYTPAAAWGLPEITYHILRNMVRLNRPELLAEVTPAREIGLAAAVNAMNDLEGLADGVARCPAPVGIWMGRDDLYFEAGRRFAGENRLAFIPLPGDHVTTLERHGAEAAARVREFMDAAAPLEGRSPARQRPDFRG